MPSSTVNFVTNILKYLHQIVIRAEHEVLGCYRGIRSNKHRIDGPIQKRRLSMQTDNHICSYKHDILTLSTLKLSARIKAKIILYPKITQSINAYRFCDPLLFVKNDQIHIALCFEVPQNPQKANVGIGYQLRL